MNCYDSFQSTTLSRSKYTDRGLCIGLRDRETDFPPTSTCGILSQDRRHKFIPLDSSCRINRTSVARIHTLVFFLLHLYTRSSAPRSRMHAGGRKPRFRPINKSRPPRSTGLPCFPHNNEKKKKRKEKKERRSILQLLDFLIPGNNRENISSPPCSSFVPLPRRTPRCLATVYQLAVSRFSF